MSMENWEQIGTIISVECQKKEWPIVTLIVSLIVSIFLCVTAIRFSLLNTLLIVLLYWLFFSLFIVYRFTRKKVLRFGTKGCLQYCRKGETATDVVIVKYNEIDAPKFDIVDYKLNGNHKNYWITISFGALSFQYVYDDDIPVKDFDYICAHKLYRYWSQYARGKEADFNESHVIVYSRLQNSLRE